MRYYIILFFNICFFYYAYAVLKKQPDWVKKRPSSEDFYIGIVVVDISKNQDEYIQIAKRLALEEISSEISISLTSNTVYSTAEINDSEFTSSFQNDIKTELKIDLEDYEFVDSWEDTKNKKYWVYYQLSKAKFKLNRQKKLNAKKNEALLYFEEGKKYELKGDVVNAMVSYLKSYDVIKLLQLQDLDVVSVELNDEFNLGSSIPKTVQNILSNIKISSKVDSENKNNIILECKLKNTQNSLPIQNLSLLVKNESNSVINLKTDENGTIQFSILQLTPTTSSNKVTFEMDIKPIISGFDKNIKRIFFNSSTIPSFTYQFDINKKNVYINVEEQNDDFNFRNEIINAFSCNLFAITKDDSIADYIFEVELKFSEVEVKSSKVGDIFTVMASLYVKVNKKDSNIELLNESIRDIKGTSINDKEKAYINAIKNLNTNLEKELLNKIALNL